jgi:hypothetical protein
MGTIIIVGVLVIVGVVLWRQNRKIQSAAPKVSIDAPTTGGTGSGDSTEQSDLSI